MRSSHLHLKYGLHVNYILLRSCYMRANIRYRHVDIHMVNKTKSADDIKIKQMEFMRQVESYKEKGKCLFFSDETYIHAWLIKRKTWSPT